MFKWKDHWHIMIIMPKSAAWTDLRALISRSPGTCDQRLTHTMPCYFLENNQHLCVDLMLSIGR